VLRNLANAGLRIEIDKRTLKDGTISLHGKIRERGKDRRYVGYIGTEAIKGYAERLASYHPRG
jgi:hypothetical protein